MLVREGYIAGLSRLIYTVHWLQFLVLPLVKQTDTSTDGEMHGETDKPTGGQVDTEMDRWISGQINRCKMRALFTRTPKKWSPNL